MPMALWFAFRDRNPPCISGTDDAALSLATASGKVIVYGP
jgi:hypothetical protein